MGKRKMSKNKKKSGQNKKVSLSGYRGRLWTILSMVVAAGLSAYAVTIAKPHIIVVDKDEIKQKSGKIIDWEVIGGEMQNIMSISVPLRNLSPVVDRRVVLALIS